MIISLYKPLGVSTHSFIKAYSDKIGEKATHTGSLDPMAEGVVVVLTGEDRFKKEKVGDVDKEYEFEILAGVQTDSWDLLGIVEKVAVLDGLKVDKVVESALPTFTGQIEQKIPRFSAKRIDGESYFDKAKRGESWAQATQKVTVKSLELVSSRIVTRDELMGVIKLKVSKVQGNFRQEEIIDRWQKVLEGFDGAEMTVLKVSAVTSKRTYVRGLVRDMSRKLNLPMTAFSIKRVRDGDFCLNNILRD
ncbi:hypothetical protein KC614_03865 [candidate division WWE3 bacterium]|uniref:tRNA pseudouridine(55) synthase n=1 Tax=candidate division WWE3 bacterium TaxID=2053526 RepID=A0A955LKY9_UNCKA|nr:hypothetical protein [candidate division WWE3 bacterium]